MKYLVTGTIIDFLSEKSIVEPVLKAGSSEVQLKLEFNSKFFLVFVNKKMGFEIILRKINFFGIRVLHFNGKHFNLFNICVT